MPSPSGWLLLAALIALAATLRQRWRHHPERRRQRRPNDPTPALEGFALQGAVSLGVVGLVATLLAVTSALTAGALAGALVLTAAALWPWRAKTEAPGTDEPAPRHEQTGRPWALWVSLAIVLGGVALRAPLHPADLGGRDQGTYVLRARSTLRTGDVHLTDRVVANAHDEARERAGATDIAGLYPVVTGPQSWLRGIYDAPYRPGFYLADRSRGLVVPQFLHLHPTLMAVTGMLLGPAHVSAVLYPISLLSLLAMMCITRRLWVGDDRWWAVFATGAYAVSPIAIWVARTPLTEAFTGLLLLAALLSVLRASADETTDDSDSDTSTIELTRAAVLLGLAAWVRGNMWMALPIVLIILAARPGGARSRVRDGGALVGLAVASLCVHAMTSFPYLHDEIGRQLELLGGGVPPHILVAAAAAGGAAWLLLDPGVFGLMLDGERRLVARLRPHIARVLPWLMAGAVVAAVLMYLSLRYDAPDPDQRPFSRLDPALPLFGAPALALAAIGGALGLLRWRPTGSRRDLWLMALLALPVIALATYARRNIPNRALYYYGRYLYPELLPVITLFATQGLAALHRRLRERATGRRRHVAHGLAVSVAAATLWTSAGVLVTHPETRLREFAGVADALDWIAARTPDDAVIIAGGEGWHESHTFNAVGAALLASYGRVVLPYDSQEAAYAVLHELLVTRPAATGEPAPPVFLLINEASHNYRPPTGDGAAGQGPRTAGYDPILQAPFAPASIDLVEFFMHRLTPANDGPPTKVTRNELRMALVRVTIDETADAAIERWRAVDGQLVGRDGGTLSVKGAKWRSGQLCLNKKKRVTIELPPAPDGRDADEPVVLVFAATPGSSTRAAGWRLDANGLRLRPRMPKPKRRRHGATLGPFDLVRRPRKIKLRGSTKKTAGQTCPYGSLSEIRLLPAALLRTPDVVPTTAPTFLPEQDLAHPIQPARWVATRSLNRFRPGTGPKPVVQSLSLELTPKRKLRFAPIRVPVPADAPGATPLDIVVSLRSLRVRPGTKLRLRINGERVGEFDVPEQRPGLWLTPPLRWTPTSALAKVTLSLVEPDADESADEGADEGEVAYRVLVRDVAFFSTEWEVQGRVADDR